MASEWLYTLLGTAIVLSCVILLVLPLRKALRALFGSGVSYLAWMWVPAAFLALLWPVESVRAPLFPPSLSAVLLGAWGVGAVLLFTALLHQQKRFIRSLGRLVQSCGVFRAASWDGGPAVVGLLHPRIVVPADFESRYTLEERELILAHERMHLRRGDLIVNAILVIARCVFWFNPLIHAAARRVRFDQELACDEAVLWEFPGSRKTYAHAMLKTQLADAALPMGCHWSSTHPLKERVLLLQKMSPRRGRRTVGRLVIAVLAMIVIYGTWFDHSFWA